MPAVRSVIFCGALDEGRCEILAERQHLLIRDSFQIVENMLGIGRVGLERVELGLLYSRIIVGSLVVAGSYRYGSFGLGYIRNSDTKRIRGGGPTLSSSSLQPEVTNRRVTAANNMRK